MRKISFIAVLLLAVFFQYCNTSKKAAARNRNSVSYQANIKPIIETACAPCHIEGKGNKKPLDNYHSASTNVDDIIARIQKNPEERGFMPMRHPKLSDATIQQFVAWKANGLREN
jgi:cytochrome c553